MTCQRPYASTSGAGVLPSPDFPPAFAGTLNEALASLGLFTQPGRLAGRKDVLRDGEVILEDVTAGMVWDWLRGGR